LSGGVARNAGRSKAGGKFFFVAYNMAKFLQAFSFSAFHRDVAENGEIIAGSGSRKVFS